MHNQMTFKNEFTIEHYRAGILINTVKAPNVICTVGANLILDTFFAAGVAVPWYVGLIDNTSFVNTTTNADTMASHANWIELIDYTEAIRQAYIPLPAAARATAQSATVALDNRAVFTINATKTLRGAFLCSDTTKSGTAGILFCTATTALLAIVSTDVLAVTYTVSIV